MLESVRSGQRARQINSSKSEPGCTWWCSFSWLGILFAIRSAVFSQQKTVAAVASLPRWCSHWRLGLLLGKVWHGNRIFRNLPVVYPKVFTFKIILRYLEVYPIKPLSRGLSWHGSWQSEPAIAAESGPVAADPATAPKSYNSIKMWAVGNRVNSFTVINHLGHGLSNVIRRTGFSS